MELNIEKINSSQRRVKFQLPADELNKEIERRTHEVSREVAAPGFRKGRVPVKLIRKEHGERINHDAIVALLKDDFEAAIESKQIIPVDTPVIEKYTFDNDLNVCDIWVTYEVVPQVTVTNIKGLKTVRPVVKVTEEDVDQEISNRQTKFQKWNTVERSATAADGILANVEYYNHTEKVRNRISEEPVFINLANEETDKGIFKACIGTAKGDHVSAEIEYDVNPSDKPSDEQQQLPDDQQPEVEKRKQTYFIEVLEVKERVEGEYEVGYLDGIDVESDQDAKFRDKVKQSCQKAAAKQVEGAIANQVLALLKSQNQLQIPDKLAVNLLYANMEERGYTQEQAAKEFENYDRMEMFELFYIAKATVSEFLIVDQLTEDRGIQLDEQAISEEVKQLQESESLDPDDEELNDLITKAKIRNKVQQMKAELFDELFNDSECETVEMGWFEFQSWTNQFNVNELQDTDDEPSEDEKPSQDNTHSTILDAQGNPIEKAS